LSAAAEAEATAATDEEAFVDDDGTVTDDDATIRDDDERIVDGDGATRIDEDKVEERMMDEVVATAAAADVVVEPEPQRKPKP
jgi:predicted thioredoxin/glutaredoxin